MSFRLKNVRDEPSPEDGVRYLVDRLWPRGLTRQRAGFDGWPKNLAPSSALRAWFGHEPAKWAEFQRRYREELSSPENMEALHNLRALAREATVTLVYAAHDPEYNNAQVLKAVLEE